MDAQRLAVSGDAHIGFYIHPEVVPLGSFHVLRVGALALLHLLDGGGGSRFGGGAGVRRRGGWRWVGGWGRFRLRLGFRLFRCVLTLLYIQCQATIGQTAGHIGQGAAFVIIRHRDCSQAF